MRSRLPYVIACLVLLASSSVAASEPYTVATLRPFLLNDINGLQLNHYFLQSLFALDATPLTLGSGVRSAPASYQRVDGGITQGGLGKQLHVFSIGFGRPRSGFAMFLGANIAF